MSAPEGTCRGPVGGDEPSRRPGVLVLTPEGGPVVADAASDPRAYDPADTRLATYPSGADDLRSQIDGPDAPLVEATARAIAVHDGPPGHPPQGGVAVTTIGYLSRGQAVLAAATERVVVSSPLLAVPMLLALLPPGRTVLLVYADGSLADPADVPGVPADRGADVMIVGLEEPGPFRRAVFDRTEPFDHGAVARQILAKLDQPNLGAVVLECGEMAAVADAVRAATAVPVVDYHSLVHFVLETTGRRGG